MEEVELHVFFISVVVWSKAPGRHAGLISVGLEATLLGLVFMLCRIEINDMCATFVP